MMQYREPDRVVIVGGGRWARVLVSELFKLLPNRIPVEIVSPSAHAVMTRWCEEDKGYDMGRIVVRADLPAHAHSDEFAVAIVANRPRDHFAAASALLTRRYHVMVEKPFTIFPAEARSLVAQAIRSNGAIMCGLVQLFAPYIADFRALLPFAEDELSDFVIDWADPKTELRHGEIKRIDRQTTIALDLVPHAWSLLRAFIPIRLQIAMELASAAPAADEIEIRATAGICSGVIRLSRSAPTRRRRVELRTPSRRAVLDFSLPPFSTAIDGAPPLVLAERQLMGPALLLTSYATSSQSPMKLREAGSRQIILRLVDTPSSTSRSRVRWKMP